MNQETKSPFFEKALEKIMSLGTSPSEALSAVFPVSLGEVESGEAGGYFHMNFTKTGVTIDSKKLFVSTGTDRPATKVDGMLAIALFLLQVAEEELAQYQATMFCKELDKLIEVGSLSLKSEDDIPDHIFQMVMVNAGAAAHDESQVPEGTVLQ